MKATITAIKRTCYASPTQYEGKPDNGKMFYLRFRWGELSISESMQPTEDINDAVDGEVVLEHQTSNEWDGLLSPEQVEAYLSSLYTFSAKIRDDIYADI